MSEESELSLTRQPTRGADRNQAVLAQNEQTAENFLFPSLEAGITLLDIDGNRGVTVLQSLVLDHLLLSDGPAFWIDADGHATTTSLAQLAPSRRLLDRIHVARGFTAYQHYAALCDLSDAVNESIREKTTTDPVVAHRDRRQDRPNHEPESSSYTPSLIVTPALDAQYRADDTLSDEHTQTLLARSLAQLSAYADAYEIPVLVTRTTTDDLTAGIERAADQHLRCEQTRIGPRFVSDEFETLLYPVEGGAYYQTTLTYWQEILQHRAEQVGLQPASPESPAENEIGTASMSDGTAATLTANPLHDAWTDTAGGR
ncbi:hypothetical protein [Haloarcula nitratireducens]|uniref:DNA recombination and repair protein Rad51-like C-terminal domain-containing protein n=1 Tax=Haloarcula nitratireducens TaxID=2487749 RepID=A0AAW4PGL1_9EURY|nr:hypothetical protein [Halomicroarcula nitratireducens]MBX0297227.1 hypothetical protein [Halomicroarcula nitratireducens]